MARKLGKKTPAPDPFAAIPFVGQNVEARSDSQGLIQLRMTLKPEPGVSHWLAHKLGMTRDARVNLDRRGSFFWSQIDGRRTLHDIERAMRERESLRRRESREAVVLFVKMLMSRRLIWLKSPLPDGAATENKDTPYVIH